MFQIEVHPPPLVHLYRSTGIPKLGGGGELSGVLGQPKVKVVPKPPPEGVFFLISLYFFHARSTFLYPSLPLVKPSCLHDFHSSGSASSHHSKTQSHTPQSLACANGWRPPPGGTERRVGGWDGPPSPPP